MTQPTNQLYGICLRGEPGWGGNMGLITSWVHAMGGRWFDEQWQPQLLSRPWQQTLELYQRLLRQYGQPHATQSGFIETLQLFAEGHCAIWVDATVAAGYLFDKQVSNVAETAGFASQPQGELPSQWLWIWALAIPNSSKQQQAAQRFIEWATSKSYVKLVADHEGWVAVPPGTRLSTYQHTEYQQQAPFALTVLQALQQNGEEKRTLQPVPYTGTIFVGIPEYAAFGTSVANRVAEIIDGKLSVDAALQQSQAIVLKQMQQSGYINTHQEDNNKQP